MRPEYLWAFLLGVTVPVGAIAGTLLTQGLISGVAVFLVAFGVLLAIMDRYTGVEVRRDAT